MKNEQELAKPGDWIEPCALALRKYFDKRRVGGTGPETDPVNEIIAKHAPKREVSARALIEHLRTLHHWSDDNWGCDDMDVQAKIIEDAREADRARADTGGAT
jgi:hypothetical protein